MNTIIRLIRCTYIVTMPVAVLSFQGVLLATHCCLLYSQGLCEEGTQAELKLSAGPRMEAPVQFDVAKKEYA
jgi:hypothetical protein